MVSLVSIVDMICPDNSNNMHTISLSPRTVTRHIGKLTAYLEQSLRDRASKCKIFSMAIDECMDLSGTAQIA
jgi:hypothetical protein